MNTAPSLSNHLQSFRHWTDDDMELGTSPLRQAEDVEFDLDMNDDFPDPNKHVTADDTYDHYLMEPDEHKYTEDDDMFDDNQSEHNHHNVPSDLDMGINENQPNDDEDILYEDEDVPNTYEVQEEAQEAEPSLAPAEVPTSDVHPASDVNENDDHAANQANNHDTIPVSPLPTDNQTVTPGLEEASAATQEQDHEDQDDPNTKTTLSTTDIQDFATKHENVSHVQEDINESVVENAQVVKVSNDPKSDGDDDNVDNEDDVEDTVSGSVEADKNADEVTLRHESAAADNESPQLHAIRLMYLEQEMSLFPPKDGDESTTFFLENSSLAYETVDRLLAACRGILGDSLGHDDEIVLDIPTLGLHICEDSKYASQLTLAQIVDTYMLLSQNEQLSVIEPLYCRLSHRVCLASQVAYLTSSAREGKTYSDIAADYIDDPESEIAEGVTENDPSLDIPADLNEQNANDFNEDAAAEPHDIYSPAKSNSDEHEALGAETEPLSTTQLTPEQFDFPVDPQTDENIEEFDHDIAGEETELSHPSGDADTKDPISEQNQSAELDTEEVQFNEEEYLAFTDDESVDGDDSTSPKLAQDLNSADSGIQESNDPVLQQTEEPQLDAFDVAQDDFTFDVEDFSEANGNGNGSTDNVTSLQPVTPSKLRDGKRKVINDDDDLEIDISTPEPKRSRAS